MKIYVAEGTFTDPKTGKKRRVKKSSSGGPMAARNNLSRYVMNKYGRVTIMVDKEYSYSA